MRKIYLLSLILTVISTANAYAQADFDYYIDFDNSTSSASSGKEYFKYTDGAYVASIKKISGEFKIYSIKYNTDATGSDNLIFGAADGQSAVTPNSEITLSNPGNVMTIGGGGAIYDATFIFDPNAMTLKIEGGTSVATKRELDIDIVAAAGTSPQTGELSFALEYIKTGTSANPTEYIVTAYYTDSNGDSQQQEITLTGGEMTGTFTFTDLKAGDLNPVQLKATAEIYGNEIYDTATAPVITPNMPILVGEISGHEWQADYGITGKQFTEIPDGKTYYYTVNLTGDGKFNFVTTLGSTATDRTSADAGISYAPSEASVPAPEKTWMPYTIYKSGGTTNAWYPKDFTPGTYVVEFDYATKSIAVVKGDIPTGTDYVLTDNTPQKADVYSISGIVVRRNADISDATAGLPAGLYIVNGKKIAVR